MSDNDNEDAVEALKEVRNDLRNIRTRLKEVPHPATPLGAKKPTPRGKSPQGRAKDTRS